MPRDRSWTRLAALVGSAAVLASCAGSGSGGRPSSTGPTAGPVAAAPASGAAPAIHWSACHGAAGPSGYQCATIAVPRDPQHPDRGQISMALDRRPATGKKIGSLLTNPGGPGASGVDFLPVVISYLPSSLRARFDVVGFDPPGVGRTAPISCLDPSGLAQYFRTDPAPTDAAGLDALIAEFKLMAAGCAQRSGAELPYVSSVDAAMDMDVIRQDLGEAQISYFGFSYGTVLGATYANLFPGRVRAMVLDGAVDPAVPQLAGLDQQSAAVDAELRAAFASCASDRKCLWKPAPNPMAAYQALADRVRVSPLPVPGSTRTVGPAELTYGTLYPLYAPPLWVDLYAALAEAEKGDGTLLLALNDAYTGRHRDGTYSNELEANPAVNCLDAPAPSVAAIEAAAPAARAAAPVFGLQNLYGELECAVWPVPATGQPGPIHAAGAPPIVVVGSTGDPATPYSWAKSLAAQLQHGVLVTREGEGHTGYPFSSCVRDLVDSYLIGLAVPAPGATCRSD